MMTLKCISPVDGSVVATRETMNLEEAAALCSRVKTAQKAWAGFDVARRVALVHHAIEILGKQSARMTHGLAAQMGRPVRYGGEFRGVSERSNYLLEIAEEALKPFVVEDTDAVLRQIVRDPLGVVLIVAPWNYPYMTAINTLVPALVAGNGVVLKHSEQTLLVGEHLAEVFLEAGIPAEVFVNIFLKHDVTAELIAGRHVDFVTFTGSVGGGKAIETAAAGTFIGVATELGGKDPAYIRHDADLDIAVEGTLDGAIFNSGQSCCGIERIYVHESLHDAFIEKAVAFVNASTLGNPFDAETTIGPMANIRFAQIVRQQIADAVSRGAVAHIEKMPADDGGAYVTPQVLSNVSHEMTVMREETFGPVVGIMPVKDDDEAVRLMNDSDYGLTASVWTADADAAAEIGSRLQTGTVYMNRCDYIDPALCWTGCKETGRSASMSVLAYQSLTRPKSYHLKKKV